MTLTANISVSCVLRVSAEMKGSRPEPAGLVIPQQHEEPKPVLSSLVGLSPSVT